jgi:hypothetical protein
MQIKAVNLQIQTKIKRTDCVLFPPPPSSTGRGRDKSKFPPATVPVAVCNVPLQASLHSARRLNAAGETPAPSNRPYQNNFKNPRFIRGWIKFPTRAEF